MLLLLKVLPLSRSQLNKSLPVKSGIDFSGNQTSEMKSCFCYLCMKPVLTQTCSSFPGSKRPARALSRGTLLKQDTVLIQKTEKLDPFLLLSKKIYY